MTLVPELHAFARAALEGARVFLLVAMDRYEIYADEAWTHGGAPLRRYWCFYGGIFGSESDLGRLDTSLRQSLARSGLRGEVKWSNVSPANVAGYTHFADCVLDAIDNGKIKFRQMFCDRANVRVAPSGEAPITDLDVQFKLCYQFIKHAFGIAFLDPARPADVLVRLDTHSSQKHKSNLSVYARGIPGILSCRHVRLQVTYEQSEKVPRIQVCDLLIGAAGSYGNKMHLLRAPGQRGMSPKQSARHQLSKHIYNRFRAIDASSRQSKAFNWFESTGMGGDRANLLDHKIRIWKFLPKQYKLDRGWQNDHLDRQGQYVRADIQPKVIDVDPAQPFWYSAGRP